MPEASRIRAALERVARELDAGADAATLDTEDLRGWQALLGGPQPAAAMQRAAGLRDTLLTPRPSTPLCELLHQGGYPGRLLNVDPTAAAVLQEEPVLLPSKAALVEEIVQRTPTEGLAAALGKVRNRCYLQLARLEVEGAPLEVVGAGLGTLVAACLEALLQHHELHERVCVIGLGKLGGGELNFFSDIDLVFVHDDGIERDGGRKALVQVHDRLRSLVRSLEGEGQYRPSFRVDLRLRPFGTQGPLSMSVSGTEAYYERHGRDWERQVWLRALALAGAVGLAKDLLQRLEPFVYRRNVTPEIFTEIRELMERARRDGGAPLHTPVADLKLDEGGIREVEFFVQALQLLHGGKQAPIRTPSTLSGLDRLVAAGLLSDHEHRALASAYRFLRRVEHRIQLGEGVQDHCVPSDLDARDVLAQRLARTLGWSPDDASARFDATVIATRDQVRAIAATLEPPAEDEPPSPRDRHRRVALDFGAPPRLRKDALRALGVADVDEAEALLAHLASRTDGPLTSHGAARRGAENLLLACLDAADPDVALRHLVEFASLRPSHYGIWRLLAEPQVEGTDLVRLTAELFGTSEPLSRGLIGFPITRGRLRDESIGLLLSAGSEQLPRLRDHAMALDQMELDPRGVHATLLRFKHQQVVTIALYDLGRRPDPLRIGSGLAELADLVLRVVLRDLAAQTAKERPAAHGLRLAVFGLGKLGMEAMDYGSDLDLMFVFDVDEGNRPTEAQTEAIRFGQHLISRLQDRQFGTRLYEVDMRLRPSGRQGLLVTSRQRFARYHDKPLPVWERLALLRMRPIAEVSVRPGLASPHPADPRTTESARAVEAALPGSLTAALAPIVTRSLIGPTEGRQAFRAEVSEALRDLKDRIEREIARESRNMSHIHVKAGRGGVLELELLVGALQLLHAEAGPQMLSRPIPAALSALADADVLPQAEVRALRAAYGFQRRLLNRLRMSQRPGIDDPDRFAQNSPRLMTLARRMGLPGTDELLAQLQQARNTVREAFDRHLPPPHHQD